MLRVSKIENFKTKNVKNFQKKTLIFGTIRPNSFFKIILLSKTVLYLPETMLKPTEDSKKIQIIWKKLQKSQSLDVFFRILSNCKIPLLYCVMSLKLCPS